MWLKVRVVKSLCLKVRVKLSMWWFVLALHSLVIPDWLTDCLINWYASLVEANRLMQDLLGNIDTGWPSQTDPRPFTNHYMRWVSLGGSPYAGIQVCQRHKSYCEALICLALIKISLAHWSDHTVCTQWLLKIAVPHIYLWHRFDVVALGRFYFRRSGCLGGSLFVVVADVRASSLW